MTIVASNSLTVSNVNDGTITHVAYANSADGTDGFTTVYPKPNLLNGTKVHDIFKGTGTANAGGTQRYTLDKSLKISDLKLSRYQDLIFEFDWKATGTNPSGNFVYQTQTYYKGTSVTISPTNTSGHVKNTFYNLPVTTDTSTFITVRQDNIPTTVTVEISNVMMYIVDYSPWMPSASEVTTADWPSYIGQYSDFTATASTDSTKYAPWTVFKGIDGNNGRGVVSIEQKYQLTQTSAKPVDAWDNSVWQTTQPAITATNKYLWSITRTTFNLAPLTQDIIEQKAVYGNTGADGNPGKIVSDTEPTTRFKGLTWKYSGTADLTASDGTVIKPNTEYYFNGKNWMINFLSANNIDANSITAEKINGTDLEVKNGKFTDGVIETSWKNGTVAGSTNIENDHLIITRTDSSVNTTNSIGLDSTQGLIMTYTENSTGRTISVGTNFQGMSLADSTGISASISPAGVKLSSDVNWTQIGNIGGRRAEWKRENNRVTMNIHGGNGDGFPVITSGGTLLGILPTNARPPSDISMPATAQGAGATAQVSINSTGEVRCYRWGGDSVYFGAYISYYVE
ncbi:hypothetical protein [Lactococcus lactis]|uniref:hypothetical protein n=1 Tax=Lactococcus lactis TaxID=1358 RepID=UPI003F29CACD